MKCWHQKSQKNLVSGTRIIKIPSSETMNGSEGIKGIGRNDVCLIGGISKSIRDNFWSDENQQFRASF